jgi:hypothetical protein
MTTRLTGALRREVSIDGEPFTVVVSAEGIRLSPKRVRSGVVLSWRALWEAHAGGATDADEGRDR